MAVVPHVPGAKTLTTLTGSELVPMAGVGPQAMQAKASLIAALAGAGQTPLSTSITTVGAGVLTAAALRGGVIVRSGPVAAYSDTTDTAAAIIAALPSGAPVGASWYLEIKNTTAFAQTLLAGVGVTLSGNKDVIPGNGVGMYLLTYSAAGAVTLQGIFVSALSSGLAEKITALATVGAGVVLGAAIAGGIVARGGAQSNTAFTDTTDTADLIIAAIPNARIGQSFEVVYQNNTDAPATLQGGVGVTVSTITVLPAHTVARYLLTYTAASTITLAGISLTMPSAVSGSFICNGATPVVVANTNLTANSSVVVTLKTVGGAVGAVPSVKTVTPGTGFTIAGTAADTSTYNYLILN